MPFSPANASCKDISPSTAREKQLRQLDALGNVGLLEKSTDTGHPAKLIYPQRAISALFTKLE
jgi:hypothetical protein